MHFQSIIQAFELVTEFIVYANNRKCSIQLLIIILLHYPPNTFGQGWRLLILMLSIDPEEPSSSRSYCKYCK